MKNNIDVVIKTTDDLLTYIRENLIGGSNISIRGLARLCGVEDTSIIRSAAFKTLKLAEILVAEGFEAADLVKTGFNAKAAWLTIEYFAYQSKAKATGAKQIARTFGMLGIMQTFKELNKPSEPQLPQTYLEALKALVKAEEEKERLALEKELLEDENLKLSEAVDELFNYSSVVRIAKYNNCTEQKFNWRVLKKISTEMKLDIKKVPCPRFQTRNLYSHDVWRVAYPDFKLPETTTLVINK